MYAFDEESLSKFLVTTPALIERYKEAMLYGKSHTLDDVGKITGGSGKGSKIPLSLGDMDLYDAEAIYLGSLAKWCVDYEVLEYFHIRGFWWNKTAQKRCLGMAGRDSALYEVRCVAKHLANHAGRILEVFPGDDQFLKDWIFIRQHARKHFPEEFYEWVDFNQAMKIADRNAVTMRSWIRDGWVITKGDGAMNTLLIRRDSIHSCLESIRMNQKEQAYRNSPFT